MLTLEQKQQFSSLLEQVASALDLTESQYQLAIDRYEAVGKWLSREESPLVRYNPVIVPQGSFRLGTVTKPLMENEEFDIDLTCRLDISKNLVTQQQLKKMVGDRIKENEDYKRMLDIERRRCWRLNYAESSRFHLDIVPAIPDEYGWLIALGVQPEWAKHAVCITDNKYWNYTTDWPKSNPEGFALWFIERMKFQYNVKRQLLAENLKMSMDEVPLYKIKTPLQIAVQILKRHRDIRFEDDDDKPVSIIITTLAALAYMSEANIYDALIGLLDRMPNYIENRNGIKWVANPVNPKENFADKWKEHPAREGKFREWLVKAKIDLTAAANQRGLNELGSSLKPLFGERIINESLNKLGTRLKEQRDAGALKMASGTGILGTIGASVVPIHNFFGKHD